MNRRGFFGMFGAAAAAVAVAHSRPAAEASLAVPQRARPFRPVVIDACPILRDSFVVERTEAGSSCEFDVLDHIPEGIGLGADVALHFKGETLYAGRCYRIDTRDFAPGHLVHRVRLEMPTERA